MSTLLDRLRAEGARAGWRRAPRRHNWWPRLPAAWSKAFGRFERLTDDQVYVEPWV